jgi:hypothetical protein
MLFFHFSAADVASQWLELLHQDIKGRLSGNALFTIIQGCSEFFFFSSPVCDCFTNNFFDNVYCSVNTALRRSKKRVRAVITTELPFLISKEFSSNQENENSTDRFSHSASADMHHAKWSTMFDQMEKALTEEEKQLVSISK